VVAMGADLLQGYHLSAPMPGDQIEGWVRQWNEQSMLGRAASADPHNWRGSSAS
jgi:hypothetical protein